MNNLKRVLSLSLAGAMLSGMMVMGASATDFPDDEDIVNQEAVEVMGSLFIINGKDDGTYDPNGLVTRAEMAKMITIAMTGHKEDTVAGIKVTPTYSDIKGHWAEKYIEYCTDMKVIAGRGDGTFDPQGNVTGVEAAKMVLSALGYEATAFHLVGADWMSNTNRIADRMCDPSLYEQMTESTNLNMALTRDNAAQMIWNGLQNLEMEALPNKDVTGGEVTDKYERTKKTMLNTRYGADIAYATLIGNDMTSSSTPEGNIRFDKGEKETYNSTTGKGTTPISGEFYFPWDTDLTHIGEEFKIIYKDNKLGSEGRPDREDTVYGVFLSGRTDVLYATRADVKSVKNEKYILKVGDVEYDVQHGTYTDKDGNTQTYQVNVTYNYATTTSYQGNQLKGTSSATSALSDALRAKNGDPVKVIFNQDNQVESVYVTHSTLGVVTSVGNDKISIVGVGSLDREDHEFYDGIATDDVVVVTQLYDTKVADSYCIVEPAEVVTGTIEAYKQIADLLPNDKINENIRVDGTEYKVAHFDKDSKDSMLTDAALGDDARPNVTDEDLGEEAELYLINGYVGGVKMITTNNNYSVVIDVDDKSSGIGSTFNGLKIQVMDADGTKSILEVDEDSKDKTILDSNNKPETFKNLVKGGVKVDELLKVGDIITYSTTKNGEAIVQVESHYDSTSSYEYDEDTKSVTVGGKTYVTTSECVMFASTSADVKSIPQDIKAYSIRNLKSLKGADAKAGAMAIKDGKAVAVFMNVTNVPSGASTDRIYGIVTGNPSYIKVDGDKYIEMNVSVNGEEHNVRWLVGAMDAAGVTMKKGSIIGFVPNSDGLYDGVNDIQDVSGSAKWTGSGAHSSFENDTLNPYAVYVQSYDAKSRIITVFDKRIELDEDGNPTTDPTKVAQYKGDKDATATYAVDADATIFYVDVDDKVSDDHNGWVGSMDPATGYLNAILIMDESNKTTNEKRVVAIIVETSNKGNIAKAK